MEILIAFLLGIVTYSVTELAKKIKVPPRLVIAACAATLAGGYLILGLLVGQQELLETLKMLGLMLATWYSTANGIYEWIQKMLFSKTEAK